MLTPHTMLTDRGTSIARRRILSLILLLFLATGAAGCAAVGGIFKAGLWVGLIIAALVIAVAFFLVRGLSR